MMDLSIKQIVLILFSLIIIKVVFDLIKGIWFCFLAPVLGFGVKWKTGDNVWAVVTGATDGIGLEYAKQLAKIGYNLVIISRNEDRLRATQKILQQLSKKVLIVQADLSKTDVYDEISNQLNNLDHIEVLVNNAGTIYHIPEYYLNIPKEFNTTYFNLNMLSATKLMDIVLPKMVEQKSGIIINITSEYSDFPSPLVSMYSATKIFLTYLSESLSVEYESKGIYIQTVLPGMVLTKIAENFKQPLISVAPEAYVRSALKTVGIERVTYGHWKHKLIGYFINNLRNLVGTRLFMKFLLHQGLDVRNKYYKQNKIPL